MKITFMIVSIAILLSACATKNAFGKFKMSQDEELGASSMLSSKIKSTQSVTGVFSAIYLNEVYPESFNGNEYFFIQYYLNDIDAKFTLRLNNNEAINIQKLPPKNRFSNIIHTQSEWSRYYLVEFKKQGDSLNLLFESNQSTSALLKYQKDEQ